MMVGVHCIYFCMRCASAFKTRDVVQRIWQMHCTANILSNCPNCTLLSAIYNTQPIPDGGIIGREILRRQGWQ